MREVTRIKYGDATYQQISCRPVGTHVMAEASAQTWRYRETGKLGPKTYRITIDNDGSYPHQSSAVLDVLHTDWVPIARLFGTEVNHLMDVSHYVRVRDLKVTAEAAFDVVATVLKTEAATLLFGDEATDRM